MVLDADGDLARGRRAYDAAAWAEAYEALQAADQQADPETPLSVGDLELLGRAAYLLGLDDDYVAALERAHRLHLEQGAIDRAIRCAWWIGHSHLFRGQGDQASGWFAKAERLVEQIPEDCVERGYVLIPRWLQQMGSGDWAGGHATAVEGARVAERFGDLDLLWLARDDQARALTRLGRIDEARRLVDEAFVTVLGGELSPIVTGIVYCNTIAFCRDALLLGPTIAWTEALSAWCDAQPEMVAHLGLCLVHRAEVFQLQGTWPAALDEARRAAERFTRGVLNRIATGQAHYRQGEIHRLRGELDEAEAAYREATGCGYEPQPGLALLRLAQGSADLAAAAIRRAITEATDDLDRVRLLPAYVEIMLAAGEADRAAAAAKELEELAIAHPGDAVLALADQATGTALLAAGDAEAALGPLRRSLVAWMELDAAYDAALVRVRLAAACAALGDADTAAFERDAARAVFERCGAAPDLARLDGPASGATVRDPNGLTARELEVLRLVAAGRTNRDIGADLHLSEHTVARHLQNMYVKLGVSSRTAASAYAFEHGLV